MAESYGDHFGGSRLPSTIYRSNFEAVYDVRLKMGEYIFGIGHERSIIKSGLSAPCIDDISGWICTRFERISSRIPGKANGSVIEEI